MAEETEKRGRGRPKGARNKSKLIKAQLAFDDAADLAADILVALMRNDREKLNISDDVPATIRLQACKVVIDKAIANERDKEPVEAPKAKATNTQTKPRVVSSTSKSA